MSKTPQPLALLIEENKIDIYQLIAFFKEAIGTEERFLDLTQYIITVQHSERTVDTIVLLSKFKKRLEIFCRQNNVLPKTMVTAEILKPEYNKLMNALKFLVLLKDFPLVLDELIDED